ncbi:MAG: zinc ribbon domain-containing protein [Acidimicrobiia bacterium]
MDSPTGMGLSDLLDLQAVDLAIDRLLHQRQTLPELTRYQEAAGVRDRLEAARKAKAGELRSAELDLDKAEGELELVEIRLKEAETRLFAGGMSGRETEQKRLEVQGLRGQQGALEERVLGLIDQVDPLRSEVGKLDDELATSNAEVVALEETISAAWKRIDAQIKLHEEEKAEVARNISGDLLALYEQLRKSKEGVAVGRLSGGVCGGCHLALSFPEQAEAADWDPPRCIHCMRILVL